jgi:hypothetical protein
MAGRDGKKQARKAHAGRRLLVGVGAGAGVFFAAAAMATGSAVTAAPARADFEDLLDPIIQPLLTSFTDSVAAFDPAAAVDLTSWTDSLLSSLSSLDTALPAAAEPAASAASSAEPAAVSTVSIPITIAEDTEPTVGATVGGASTTLLVDTGSSGLVVPLTDLDGGSTNFLTELDTLFSLGSPASFGEGGYSGGVDYIYLTYDNVAVDYGGVDTTAPVEVEVYSWDPSDLSSLFTNDAFQGFDTGNDVTGILGIGTEGTGGVGESPIEAAGYQGVTVDLPAKELTLDATPNTTGIDLSATGSTVSGLTETVTNSSGQVGTGTVSDDLDSGGVYGTIPSSIAGSNDLGGDTITVYDNGTPLYSYLVGTESDGTDEAPGVVSGTSIDSGVEPFLSHEISIDYTSGDLYLNH